MQVRRANTLGASVGTSELEAPERAQDHFSAAPSDVTATRALATTYTNSSSTARFIVVSLNTDGTSGADALVDGNVVANMTDNGGGVSRFQLVFIVPPGSTYRVNENGATTTINRWTEWQL